jgi:predicted DNA-binding transcriptional regulator AlpA
MTAKKFVADNASTAVPPSTAAPALQQTDILEKEAVCAMLGVKKRCLEGLVLREEFPPPGQLGRKVYWSRQAVEQWRNIKFAPQLVWVSG